MNFEPGNLYHIYNQGNNRQFIFSSREDYIIFLNEIKRLILPHCELIAYCLMPNHFHLLVYTDDRILAKRKHGIVEIDPLANGIRELLSGYAKVFNNKYGRSGSLFRQKTKAKLLSTEDIFLNGPLDYTDYAGNCFQYIHENPYKADLVKKMEDWEFSSYRDHAGLRKETLCNREITRHYGLGYERY